MRRARHFQFSFSRGVTPNRRGLSWAAACCVAVAAMGCGEHDVSVPVTPPPPQMPLKGTLIPRFVDALPTFNGRRADGTQPLSVDMQEFQQKVLPEAVYRGRKPPYNNGTFLWGYNLNGVGPSWPARTIEARQGTPTNVTYTNSLTNTVLQGLLTVDQTLHWADPLGTTANNTWRNPAPNRLSARFPRSCTCTAPRSSPSSMATRTPGSYPARLRPDLHLSPTCTTM